MGTGLENILGPDVVGLLDSNGKLTPAARSSFTEEVLNLQVNGNRNGKGLFLSNLLPVGLPPIPGPTFTNPITKVNESLFWFEPELYAAAAKPYIEKPDSDFQKNIVDQLYEPIVKMLNLKGSFKLLPIYDPSISVPTSKIKFQNIPDFVKASTEISILLPQASSPDATGVAAKAKLLSTYGIADDEQLRFVKLIANPPIPDVPIPPLPLIPQYNFISLDDLALGLFQLPLNLLASVPGSLANISIDPPSLFTKFFNIALDATLEVLKGAGLLIIAPKLLIASILVIVKNIVIMTLTVGVGITFGAGQLCKLVATLLGLI